MTVNIPFSFSASGDEADEHVLPAYDGYRSLAGFAWTLSLVTEYAETGRIRHRGSFEGRGAVRATAIRPGSVTSDFFVAVSQNPLVLGVGGVVGTITVGMVTNFLYDIVKRTIDRNLGREVSPASEELQRLEAYKGGDLEALVAATESSIQQSHMVINNGVKGITINGSGNNIAVYNQQTKDYVNQTILERDVRSKDVSVASFNANSGYGSVYDGDLGRTIPIKVGKENMPQARAVLSWGLHEYARGSGRRVSLTYQRMLAMDGTPKKYVVLEAEQPED